MKKWFIRLGVLIGVVVIAMVAKNWFFVQEPVEVKGVQVERAVVEESITNSRAGTVKARQRAHLSAELGGRVVAVPFDKGATVKKGQILLQLNDAAEQARLKLTQRDLVVAKAERDRFCLAAERADREHVRYRDLSEKELVSIDELDRVESVALTTSAACAAGKAGVDRAQAAIGETKAALDKTVLYAPFDGILASVDVEVGEWVTPAPPAVPVPPVLDLIDPTSIYISAPMDEVDSAKILTGQSARISLDPYPGKQFSGKVVQVAPFVEDREEQNRTVDVEVELDDTRFATTLLPGTSADVELILSVQEDVLRIPRSTVLEGNVVWVVEGGQLAERPIEVGLKNWNYVEVVSGLEEGEWVVTSLDQADVTVGHPATLIKEASQ
jgi:HlyD family secretion protein